MEKYSTPPEKDSEENTPQQARTIAFWTIKETSDSSDQNIDQALADIQTNDPKLYTKAVSLIKEKQNTKIEGTVKPYMCLSCLQQQSKKKEQESSGNSGNTKD